MATKKTPWLEKQRVGTISPAMYTIYFPLIHRTVGFSFNKDNIKLAMEAVEKEKPIGCGYMPLTADVLSAKVNFPLLLINYFQYLHLATTPMLSYDDWIVKSESEMKMVDFDNINQDAWLAELLTGEESIL